MTFPKRRNGGIDTTPEVVPVALARAVLGSGRSVPVVPAALVPDSRGEPPNEEISGPSPTIEGEEGRFAPRNPVGNVWTPSMIHYKAEGVNNVEEGRQIEVEAASSGRGEETHYGRQIELDASAGSPSTETGEDTHYSIPKKLVWMCLGVLFLVLIMAGTVGITKAVSGAYGSASDEHPFSTTPPTEGATGNAPDTTRSIAPTSPNASNRHPAPSNMPSDFPSMPPSNIPSQFPSMPPIATIADKAGLLAAIDRWTSSDGTDMTYGLTINDWDVSRVSDFSDLFLLRSSFNDPINDWETGQVTNMDSMFRDATAFNQPLNNWETSQVTTMDHMFRNSGFNQDINGWNVGKVTSMYDMFAQTVFNQNLASWDVSSVEMFRGMFYFSRDFNQDISWDVGSATNMRYMFWGAHSFNQPLNLWNVSRVSDFSGMFNQAKSFNQDISDWDMSAAVELTEMFQSATSFNQDMCAWGQQTSASAAVANMFASTRCPSGDDPNLASTPVTPLCHACL